jgi:hypothetical protein
MNERTRQTTDQKGHLGREDELVFFEQASRGVDECQVGNRFDEIEYSRFDIFGRFGSFDGIGKDHFER